MNPVQYRRFGLRRFNEEVRRWWPVLVGVIGTAMLIAIGYVMLTIADERDLLVDQNKQLVRQQEQLAQIIENNRQESIGREARLERAVEAVQRITADQFAEHDLNTSLKLNEMLQQITALLSRPAGTSEQPVVGITIPTVLPRQETSSGTSTTTPTTNPPRTTTTTAPARTTTTTTTTTPRQRVCAEKPDLPQC